MSTMDQSAGSVYPMLTAHCKRCLLGASGQHLSLFAVGRFGLRKLHISGGFRDGHLVLFSPSQRQLQLLFGPLRIPFEARQHSHRPQTQRRANRGHHRHRARQRTRLLGELMQR